MFFILLNRLGDDAGGCAESLEINVDSCNGEVGKKARKSVDTNLLLISMN